MGKVHGGHLMPQNTCGRICGRFSFLPFPPFAVPTPSDAWRWSVACRAQVVLVRTLFGWPVDLAICVVGLGFRDDSPPCMDGVRRKASISVTKDGGTMAGKGTR